jgi:hypothetical protein
VKLLLNKPGAYFLAAGGLGTATSWPLTSWQVASTTAPFFLPAIWTASPTALPVQASMAALLGAAGFLVVAMAAMGNINMQAVIAIIFFMGVSSINDFVLLPGLMLYQPHLSCLLNDDCGAKMEEMRKFAGDEYLWPVFLPVV